MTPTDRQLDIIINTSISDGGSIMKICPKCGNEHDKPGMFCSRACANARTWSVESKQKRSVALKQHIADHPEWRIHHKDKIAERAEVQKQTLASKNYQRFLDGLITDGKALKKWLIATVGETCTLCGMLPEWNGNYLSLQVDHVDGNHKNNHPTNIRLVCPNCHSQTDTFSGKKHRNKMP